MSDYISKTDEKGIVNALFQENTFTELDDFIELYQNSDDASSKMMKVKLIEYNGKSFLFISDDGSGMDMETMGLSLNLLGKTKGKRKHGKFNFGGKAGQLHLSGIGDCLNGDDNYNGMCITISKAKECNPVCYTMIGKELIENGWAGQVKVHEIFSGQESIDSRELYKEYPIDETGTHIFIELTESRLKKLKDCENELRKELSLACNERLNHCGMSICFNESDNGILKYTPILKEDIIDEKKRSTNIDVYMKGTEKLYMVDENGVKKVIKLISEIRQSYSTELKELSESDLDGYEKKGTFILSSACDYEYIKGEYSNSSREKLNNIYLIRNGFCLNCYDSPLNTKSHNAHGFNFHKTGIYKNTIFTLTYESSDIMDSLIGVNMQKADIKFGKLEKPFQRTIERLVLEHANVFVEYIRENEYNPQNLPEPEPEPHPVPHPVPEPVPGSDSESDSEESYTSPSSTPRSISSELQPEPEPNPGELWHQLPEPEPEPEPQQVEVQENLKMMLEEKILVYINDDRDDSEMNNKILKILENYGY